LQVLAFFTQNDNHVVEGMGLALDYVANGLRVEGTSEKDVRGAVGFLVNEGRFYSTIGVIDDYHYKCTV
jgi:hypothetical protein